MIYLYGMIMSTWNYLMEGAYPEEDGYGEIKEKYHLIGGETGTAAVVLASLGEQVKIDGTYLGKENKDLIKAALKQNKIDGSRLVEDESYNGVQDMAIICGSTRTCFGQWSKVFEPGNRHWNECQAEDVLKAETIGLDPFFGDQAPELCKSLGKSFVTIDSTYDSIYTEACEAIIVSHQYLNWLYPEQSIEELMKCYTEHTKGLVIFTFGGGTIFYGRKGEAVKSFKPYKVKVKSTLGAGDSFKAGVIYGVHHHLSDDQIVQFAAATAAVACSKFPISLNPPTLQEVQALIQSRTIKDYFKRL